MKKTINLNLIINLIIILGIISLFLEDLIIKYKFIYYLNNVLDYIIYILYFISTVGNLIINFKDRKKLIWNIIEISIILIFSALFFYSKLYLPFAQNDIPQHLYTRAVLIRNIFL
ncbi:MAG: hypothetical protein JXB50_05545, partial [Spirochaetes bacterium]|nr:hypothetical protein [Spirochaetota bacterium]